MSFYDEFGLLHCKPNEISENSPLFTAEEMLLNEMMIEKRGHKAAHFFKISATAMIASIWNNEESRYQDRAGEAGLHFSLDNMNGVYAMARFSKWLPKSGLEKQVTRPSYFLHPKDWLFFALCEHKWWAILGYPLVFLALLTMAVQSCMQPRHDTSGKLLWFVRARTLIGYNYPLSSTFYNTITNLMVKEHGENPWVDVFGIYFPYAEHPSNILARQIWSK